VIASASQDKINPVIIKYHYGIMYNGLRFNIREIFSFFHFLFGSRKIFFFFQKFFGYLLMANGNKA